MSDLWKIAIATGPLWMILLTSGFMRWRRGAHVNAAFDQSGGIYTKLMAQANKMEASIAVLESDLENAKAKLYKGDEVATRLHNELDELEASYMSKHTTVCELEKEVANQKAEIKALRRMVIDLEMESLLSCN